MPNLIVLENIVGPEKQADLPDGGALLDVADDKRLPIPFSCRSATCATCHVEVVSGAEFLEPPGAEELDLLDMIGASETSRLACQAVVKSGSGEIRIKPV